MMYVLVYVIVFCVENVCMLPQPGKNGYADWYEFKSKINQSINQVMTPTVVKKVKPVKFARRALVRSVK